MPDIQNRIAEADAEYFRLTQLWKGHRLTLRHRLKLFRNYQAIVRYGSHNWFLTDKVKAKLTGWAAKRLSPIVDTLSKNIMICKETGKVIRTPLTEEETAKYKGIAVHMQAADPAILIVQGIEHHQFLWLGKKLRLPPERIIRIAILRAAYQVMCNLFPDGGQTSFFRAVLDEDGFAQFESPKHLAICAGWEPADADLQEWTVQDRAQAEVYRDSWAAYAEELKPADLDKRLDSELLQYKLNLKQGEKQAATERTAQKSGAYSR